MGPSLMNISNMSKLLTEGVKASPAELMYRQPLSTESDKGMSGDFY